MLHLLFSITEISMNTVVIRLQWSSMRLCEFPLSSLFTNSLEHFYHYDWYQYNEYVPYTYQITTTSCSNRLADQNSMSNIRANRSAFCIVSKSSRLSAVSVKLRAPNVRGALRRRPIVWTISRLHFAWILHSNSTANVLSIFIGQ